MGAGSLTVVGTGIQLASQVTPHTRAVIERADEVLYLVADPLTAVWIERLNPNARSLDRHYEPGKDRAETYAAIVEETLARVRAAVGCALPSTATPASSSIPATRRSGAPATRGSGRECSPPISAEDCLVADLGLDPGETWLPELRGDRRSSSTATGSSPRRSSSSGRSASSAR